MSVFPAAVKLKGFKAPAQHKLRGRFYDVACRQKICLSLMLVRSFILCYNVFYETIRLRREEYVQKSDFDSAGNMRRHMRCCRHCAYGGAGHAMLFVFYIALYARLKPIIQEEIE